MVRVDGWAEAIGRASWALRSDCAAQEDVRPNAATLSLVGFAQRITAILIMNGRLDRIVPCRDAEGLREVRGPVAEFSDELDELPDDIEDSEKYVPIPDT